jgi:hypothetical protein
MFEVSPILPPGNQRDSPFFQLPGEIREQILRELLISFCPIVASPSQSPRKASPVISPANQGSGFSASGKKHQGLHAQILGCCQQLYQEGIPLLYQQNTLLINVTPYDHNGTFCFMGVSNSVHNDNDDNYTLYSAARDLGARFRRFELVFSLQGITVLSERIPPEQYPLNVLRYFASLFRNSKLAIRFKGICGSFSDKAILPHARVRQIELKRYLLDYMIVALGISPQAFEYDEPSFKILGPYVRDHTPLHGNYYNLEIDMRASIDLTR